MFPIFNILFPATYYNVRQSDLYLLPRFAMTNVVRRFRLFHLFRISDHFCKSYMFSVRVTLLSRLDVHDNRKVGRKGQYVKFY